jgi:NADPH-dependent 2,4-dienoyl-CoA reductase/sulfur reductase-like enzyme
MSAASRARRVNPQMEVVVLEKGATVSYGACGLPFLLSGEVTHPDDLIALTEEQLREQRGIDVRPNHEVVEIIPGRKNVKVKINGDSDNIETFKYDKLVITTGAAPAMNIEGAGREGVFHCNNMAGAKDLLRFLNERKPQQACVIGGGYIGLEVADALRQRGLEVHLIEQCGRLLGGLEPEIAGWVTETLTANGVRVSLDSPVHLISPKPRGGLSVLYGGNISVEPDFVLLATGLKPRVALAEAAGIEIGKTGAIKTDHQQLTNLHGVYAAGDCTETRHLVSDLPAYVPLGTTANKQGRVAGENAAGGRASFPGVAGTLITKAFGLEIAKTGLSAADAKAAGFQPETVTIDSRSRAHYMGGKAIRVTLVMNQGDGRLLGAQLAGEEGAARRVDTVATALTHGMLLKDIVHLDLGYAPPFGPVYDPLLVATWEGLKKLGQRR